MKIPVTHAVIALIGIFVIIMDKCPTFHLYFFKNDVKIGCNTFLKSFSVYRISASMLALFHQGMHSGTVTNTLVCMWQIPNYSVFRQMEQIASYIYWCKACYLNSIKAQNCIVINNLCQLTKAISRST